jgi:LAO/AO transport system kinase
MSDLLEGVLAGDHRALARAITHIENRQPGYRELVADLHAHTGSADIIGITGSPGSGKSTLVDKLAAAYRERGLTVGVIAIDPSSPYTGGAVLGDRIRMASNIGDMDVFFRSMSARGTLGGLSTATADAVKALDAFGKDRILVETVGAGQNEVDIVKTADTVTVLVPPDSGDDVQMLKAGILEIADVFVVNKADLSGADRTVRELREMLQYDESGTLGQSPPTGDATGGHHGAGDAPTGHGDAGGGHADDDPRGGADQADGDPHGDGGHGDGDPHRDASQANGDSHGTTGHGPSEDADVDGGWETRIVETVATSEDGIDDLLDVFDDHATYLDNTGEREANARARYAAEIRRQLREDVNTLVSEELDQRGGIEQFVERVLERETDPYTVTDEILEPLIDCLERERRQD